LDVAPWRVAVTRDEDLDGPLSRALRDAGLEPVLCPVVEEHPPRDAAALGAAAARLEQYDWVLCSSVRAVTALMAARAKPWPRGVRAAAVGPRTAAALNAAGADPPPLVAGESGADALWRLLQGRETWRDRRVLVPAAPGGRRALIDGLRSAGARVDEVEAYRMLPRPPDLIAATWKALAPDAVVLASPFTAQTLVRSIGRSALTGLRAVAAVGPTTAAALTAHGIPCSVPPRAGFAEVARHLSAEWTNGAASRARRKPRAPRRFPPQ
jgi:uroporphyrinogen-III synthase